MVNIRSDIARLTVGTEGSILEEFDLQNLVAPGKNGYGMVPNLVVNLYRNTNYSMDNHCL